jgi:hypothetical protein
VNSQNLAKVSVARSAQLLLAVSVAAGADNHTSSSADSPLRPLLAAMSARTQSPRFLRFPAPFQRLAVRARRAVGSQAAGSGSPSGSLVSFPCLSISERSPANSSTSPR